MIIALLWSSNISENSSPPRRYETGTRDVPKGKA